ncbi:GNAT family N-acetyltransferase [Enterovibrio coralii]|uniref:GNAT family N-acetyltransferase n=1 Tax=Enterovibrio coralii TaxID=294935 RepID=UPI0009F9797E|nr:GNAT family N-acetyltransferase [Enterovibrio coralii]
MPFAKEIRSELRYLVRELGLLDKNCLNSGLSLSQVHVLTYLRKNGVTSFAELGTQLNVEKASLSRTLNGLITKGYVGASANENDKRQKCFRLEPKGLKRLGTADNSANQELSQLLEYLEPQEAQSVIDGLRLLRLSAFRKSAAINKTKIQIETLSPVYREDIDALLRDTFHGEQKIPEDLVPLARETTQKWWVARSGEYVLGAVAGWEKEGAWHWGRFVVDNRFRGCGIGKALALHSLRDLLTITDEILIDARDTTVSIVQTLGGTVTGEKVDFYGLPVTPMKLIAEDFELALQSSGTEISSASTL